MKRAGVDCIKAVLESGAPGGEKFNHLDAAIYQAILQEAIRQNLPVVTHTGNARDVDQAVRAGSTTIEHGSFVDLISPETFALMKAKGTAYDPTLSVVEALINMKTGNAKLLSRPLLDQIGLQSLLNSTREMIMKTKNPARPEQVWPMLDTANENFLNAYRAGVLLISGSDAGNMLVIHGPTMQHELAFWVEAGAPAKVALKAATYNAAKRWGPTVAWV